MDLSRSKGLKFNKIYVIFRFKSVHLFILGFELCILSDILTFGRIFSKTGVYNFKISKKFVKLGLSK